jgi:hypothetical protein
VLKDRSVVFVRLWRCMIFDVLILFDLGIGWLERTRLYIDWLTLAPSTIQ